MVTLFLQLFLYKFSYSRTSISENLRATQSASMKKVSHNVSDFLNYPESTSAYLTNRGSQITQVQAVLSLLNEV